MGRSTGGNDSVGNVVHGSFGDNVLDKIVGSFLVGIIVVDTIVGSLFVGDIEIFAVDIIVGFNVCDTVGIVVLCTPGLLVLDVGFGLGRTYMGRITGGNDILGDDVNVERIVGVIVCSIRVGRDGVG
jgi:hypothetical protein